VFLGVTELGRSEGKNKLAESLLAGADITITGSKIKIRPTSSLDLILKQIKGIREEAIRAGFYNSDIDALNFQGPADLTAASFQGARVVNSYFKGSKLNLANLQDSFFDECIFDQASFDGAVLEGAKFKNCSFKNVDLKTLDAKPTFVNCVFD
jgi:uncharacterized protein YjbI with pentapeptide repeats